MSTFSEFLSTHEIKEHELIRASRRIETHDAADRALSAQRARVRASGDRTASRYAEGGLAKPRSGRPLSRDLVERAMAGRMLTRPSRAKLLRAVNRELERRSQPRADVTTLFGRS